MELHKTKFELTEYGMRDGAIPPPHPSLKDFNCFNLSVENCRITDVRILYRIIKDQLNVENNVLDNMTNDKQDPHPLQYCVREFLENILSEMDKVEGINNLGYYAIKGR